MPLGNFRLSVSAKAHAWMRDPRARSEVLSYSRPFRKNIRALTRVFINDKAVLFAHIIGFLQLSHYMPLNFPRH